MATAINDTLQNNSPKDLNNKTGKFVNGSWEPFASLADAKSTVTNYRYKGLTQIILKNGVPTEYWYRDGITDNDLIQKHMDQVQLTQSQYDALSVKDPNTVYYIVG